MTKPYLLSGLMLLSLLAACSSQPATPAALSTPTGTPSPIPSASSTPTSTPTPTPPPTATLPPISLTFKPVADSYVDKSHANNNFGTSNSLRVDNSPVVNSYLRFTVMGLGERTINRVRLLIYAYSASTHGMIVSTVMDNTWGERTITSNTAPALGSTLVTSPQVLSRTWVTFDVTTYVTGEGTFSFGLSTPGTAAISMASRESITFSPQLIVDLN